LKPPSSSPDTASPNCPEDGLNSLSNRNAKILSEERQEQIRQEALRIIHYRGYSNLSIRELAKNVGISEAAIYRHFPSKDAITVAVLKGLVDQFTVLKHDLSRISSKSDLLFEFIIHMIRYLENNHEMTALLFSDEVFPPDSPAADMLQSIILERQRFLKNIIEESQNIGELRKDVPADDLVLIIMGLIHKVVAEWRRLGFRFDMVSRVQDLLKSLKILFR